MMLGRLARDKDNMCDAGARGRVCFSVCFCCEKIRVRLLQLFALRVCCTHHDDSVH